MARTAIDATDATLDEPLPDALGENLQALFDRDRPADTVGDWVRAVRDAAHEELGGSIQTDHLCHVDDGDHVTRVLDDDENDHEEAYNFACFYDGLVLAGMTESAVEVETVCPETDEPVRFEGTLDDLSSDAAVVSIGVANDPGSVADDDGSFATAYGATCPYVRAFTSREAYEAWREDVDAATVGLSPAVALAAAKALAA